MNTPDDSDVVLLYRRALVPFAPTPRVRYPLETVARLAQVSRHRVALYYKHGLLVTLGDPAEGGWFFDAEAIRAVRQLEELRRRFGMNIAGTRVVWSLLREVSELRRELAFLRRA